MTSTGRRKQANACLSKTCPHEKARKPNACGILTKNQEKPVNCSRPISVNSYCSYPDASEQSQINCLRDCYVEALIQSANRCLLSLSGKKNGVQKIWVDGDLWLSQNNVVFDNTGKHDISILKFDNFHGGKSDKFRPKKTQFVWCGPPPSKFSKYAWNPIANRIHMSSSHASFICCGGFGMPTQTVLIKQAILNFSMV